MACTFQAFCVSFLLPVHEASIPFVNGDLRGGSFWKQAKWFLLHLGMIAADYAAMLCVDFYIILGTVPYLAVP
jgi:hypothetical protein